MDTQELEEHIGRLEQIIIGRKEVIEDIALMLDVLTGMLARDTKRTEGIVAGIKSRRLAKEVEEDLPF